MGWCFGKYVMWGVMRQFAGLWGRGVLLAIAEE